MSERRTVNSGYSALSLSERPSQNKISIELFIQTKSYDPHSDTLDTEISKTINERRAALAQ